MGIWKIDNVNKEESLRREMRRHNIRQWMITLAEIGGMAAMVMAAIWLVRWLGI